MSISARTYTRRSDGSLAVYQVTDVASFDEAIQAVKKAEGTSRALCLVQSQPEVATQPVEDQEAVA